MRGIVLSVVIRNREDRRRCSEPVYASIDKTVRNLLLIAIHKKFLRREDDGGQ